MEKTCRLVHITYRENNRGPGREEYKNVITFPESFCEGTQQFVSGNGLIHSVDKVWFNIVFSGKISDRICVYTAKQKVKLPFI